MPLRMRDRSLGVAMRKRSNSPCGRTTEEQNAAKSSPTSSSTRALTAVWPTASGFWLPGRRSTASEAPLRRSTRVTSHAPVAPSKAKRTLALSAPVRIRSLVSRASRCVLPYRAYIIASRTVDLPAPVGPTMPNRLLPSKVRVCSSA